MQNMAMMGKPKSLRTMACRCRSLRGAFSVLMYTPHPSDDLLETGHLHWCAFWRQPTVQNLVLRVATLRQSAFLVDLSADPTQKMGNVQATDL